MHTDKHTEDKYKGKNSCITVQSVKGFKTIAVNEWLNFVVNVYILELLEGNPMWESVC